MAFTNDMILVPRTRSAEVAAALEAVHDFWERERHSPENEHLDLPELRTQVVAVSFGTQTLLGIPTATLPEQAEHFLLSRLPMGQKPTVAGQDPLRVIFPHIIHRLGTGR